MPIVCDHNASTKCLTCVDRQPTTLPHADVAFESWCQVFQVCRTLLSIAKYAACISSRMAIGTVFKCLQSISELADLICTEPEHSARSQRYQRGVTVRRD
jgi:hypothetical protein